MTLLVLPRGSLLRDEDGLLLCHLCGVARRRLATHVRRSHSLSPEEYRKLCGLNRQTMLFSDQERARLREMTAPVIARLRADGALRNWGEDQQRLERDKRAATEVLRTEGLRTEGRVRRSASFDPARRAAQSERTRQRNLSGELRASPQAISAGLRRSLVCCDCGDMFETSGSRSQRCGTCRANHIRAYNRAWRRQWRTRRSEDS